MNKVAGKVLLHDTGAGISNLVVTVYDVDSESVPQDAGRSEPTQLIQFWNQLQGNRLGSVLTDKEGEFALEYDERELKGRRPDLLLFVTAPERAGLDGCSPVLHVSCGLRENAGRIESYLIRLTAEQVESAGVPLPTGQVPQPPRPRPALRALSHMAERREASARALDRVRLAWREAELPAPRVAEVYRTKTKALQQAAARNRSPENGFRLAFPVLSAGAEAPATMTFDAEAHAWVMHKGEERAALIFAGVVSASESKPEERPAAGINVVLDAQKKQFRIVVARVPVRLREAESGPGGLFVENLRHRHRRAKTASERSNPARSTRTIAAKPHVEEQ